MSVDQPGQVSSKLSQPVIIYLFFLLAGILIGRYLLPPLTAGNATWQFTNSQAQRQFLFPTFWEAWDHLHDNFLANLDDKNLLYGAVTGMVRAANDPYTVFSDPESSKQFQQTLSGHFSGIGVEIGVQNGLVTVISPLSGSPADKAGIKQGDIIVAVDDKSVTPDTSLDEIVQQIRGPLGQPVKLTVARRGEQGTKDISVVRDTIKIESVNMTIADGVAHLTITSFNGDTAEQFAKLAKQVQGSRPRAIVLDLRNNPGGFLESAVDIASYWLDPGVLVVSERGKQETDYKAHGGQVLGSIPTVVVVNGGSASASEILAGALHDQRQIRIIGEKTFGKGSVQELINLNDGSSLRVTVAKWYTPSGRSINDQGIEPDVKVEDNPQADGDEQLTAAVKELAGN